MPENDSARTNIRPAVNSDRFRRERSALAETATAVSAASPPAIPA